MLLNYRIKAPILMEKHNFTSKTTKERGKIIFKTVWFIDFRKPWEERLNNHSLDERGEWAVSSYGKILGFVGVQF